MDADRVEREQGLASLASVQHGVVSRRQLEAVGLRRGAIARRVESGRLHRLHHGVYALGHPVLTVRGHWLAAVLACGDGAVLSHASAAAAWDLRRSDASLIDVIVPVAGGRKRRGIRIHRRPDLARQDTTTLDGIPITTPTRTLIDLAPRLTHGALKRTLAQTEARRLLDDAQIADAFARRSTRSGAKRLQQALQDPTITRSELEDRFLALLDRERLPRPLVNHHVLHHEVDFVWPTHRLIVETDGREHHGTAEAFEHDRRRDVELTIAGYRVVRFTHRQVTEHAATTAAELHALLSRSRA